MQLHYFLHKIVFSEEAKTTEVKKRKLTYDVRQIIGQRDKMNQEEEFREPKSPKGSKMDGKEGKNED